MIPDSIFYPTQSPCFVLLKVLVSPFSKSWFSFSIRVQFSPSYSFLSKSSSPPLRVLFPSSPSPVPVLSESRSHPLRPLSSSQSPLPSSTSQRKQRNDTKPSRRYRGGSFQNGTYQVIKSA